MRLPPAHLGPPQANTDCIVHTIPCTACFAMCQEANEIKASTPAADAASLPGRQHRDL
jgi:hypothetical protein